ncbi:MAG: hypothetical protein JKY22_12205 [Flavobacteriaceae bacterium]|nr:hypothetical protein [Flavobacteriaceae bacterium]PCJ26514.1 MAG: hypothetical protein COA94_05240 [Rickettsiales bacterium]
MEIILIKALKYGYTRIIELDDFQYSRESHIVISKPLKIEFEMLPESDQVNAEVNVLRDIKEKGLADAQVVANKIDEKIQSLLAIEDKR